MHKSFILFLLINFSVFQFGISQVESIDIRRGNEYFEKGFYQEAIRHYSYALKANKSLFVLERLSDCYFKLRNFKEAEGFFYEAYKKFSLDDPQKLKYAILLKMNGKFKSSGQLLFSLQSSGSLDKKYIQNLVASFDSIRYWKEKVTYNVSNIKGINSRNTETSPVLRGDSLVFASNKEGVIIRKKSKMDGLPFFNLYVASVDKEFKIGKPTTFSKVINSPFHESSASFAKNGSIIYFTRCGENLYINDTVKRMKLYASVKSENGWVQPHTFIMNDSTYSFAHPSVEKDEKMVFFASDMKGGYGGTDIYVCIQVEDSIWSDPINLGPVINSPGNESYPFYHEDGSLYFSSDYHLGMGGYDIFVAEQRNGDWVKIKNLGFPINSTYDDMGIYFNKDKSRGYLSSNRPGGKGKEDIYLIEKK